MRSVAKLTALGRVDARSTWRDPVLMWAVVLPIATGAMLRLLEPAQAHLGPLLGIDARPLFPLVWTYAFLMMTPLLVGFAVGFLLLDERDDRTLDALLVTPVSARLYLAYRVGAPALAAAAVSVPGVLLAGALAPPPGVAAASLVVAALGAPVLALLLASLARNKVEGFALTKAIGVVSIAPLVAFFAAPPWQHLAGLVPSYWPSRAAWAAARGEPGAAAYLAIGLAYHLALLTVLARRLDRTLRS
jgi:fluoroquinolone transport system permease protein